MSRKTLLIIIVGLLLVCAVAFYFFFRPALPVTEEVPTESTCLVFQNSDPSKPCFAQSNFPVGGGKTTSTSSESTITISPIGSTTKISLVETTCATAANGFEKNDCIATIAKTKNDKTLCDYVTGVLAQNACKQEVAATSSSVTAIQPSQTYQDFVQKYFIKSGTTAVTSNIPNETATPTVGISDEQKVKYNLSYGAPLAVYAASRYQVVPGGAFKVYGSGFSLSGNVLNVGDIQTTVGSTDGNTLEATAPASMGDYEIWVTNAKGSSRVGDRPVKITVTSSPADLPVIEKATPSPVSADGTVILSGTGFASTNNILTSLGILMNVPSDGHTISISMSSLPYISYAKAAAALKGKISPVLVNIQTPGGVNEKIFQFDVQF